MFNNITKAQQGTYTVTATNASGSDSAKVTEPLDLLSIPEMCDGRLYTADVVGDTVGLRLGWNDMVLGLLLSARICWGRCEIEAELESWHGG